MNSPPRRDLRVVLADDHASVRAAVRSVLFTLEGVSLAGEATTWQETLDLLRAVQPDVALIDIRLKGMNGIDVAEHAWMHAPDTCIVLLAMRSEAPAAGRLPPGIAGLVAKEAAATDLAAALDAVARGQRYASPTLTGQSSAPGPAARVSRGTAWADE